MTALATPPLTGGGWLPLHASAPAILLPDSRIGVVPVLLPLNETARRGRTLRSGHPQPREIGGFVARLIALDLTDQWCDFETEAYAWVSGLAADDPPRQ